MRLNIVLSNRFKKDLKLAKKRGLDLELLNPEIMSVNSCQHNTCRRKRMQMSQGLPTPRPGLE